jgi:uncharacterized oxidoreductase
MHLTDDTILVTGGGSGIGAGLATALHRAGNRVVIAGRRRDALDAVAREHPGMTCYAVDLADPASVRTFAAEVVDRHPDLNVLVNNAGIMPFEDLTDPRTDVIQAVCATNLVGPLLLTAELLPTLRAAPRAAIVNVTSALGFVPMARMPTYCATKAALHSYTQSLRSQLRRTSVRVIEIPPPRVYTRGEPEDVDGLGVATFVDEALALMAAHPSDGEIKVAAARHLCDAASRGEYDEVYAAVNPDVERTTP